MELRFVYVRVFAILVCTSGEPHQALESVTLPLREYKELFRQANLLEDNRELENRRLALEREFEESRKKIQSERQRMLDEDAHRSEREKVLSGNWILLNHTADGMYRVGDDPEEQSMALFDIALNVHIFENVWTAIPIVDSRTILASDWEVTKEAEDHSISSVPGSGEPVRFGPDIFIGLNRRVISEDIEDYTLMTSIYGSYWIRFKVYVRVPKNRNLHTLTLSLVYPIAATTLSLQYGDDAPRVIKELSVDPAAYYEVVEGKNQALINVRLPSTKTVEMKWRMSASSTKPAAFVTSAIGSDMEEDAKEEPAAQIAVLQNALHSVSENVLQSESTFKFTMDTPQSLNSVQINVLGAARVTSVTAYGLQTWRTARVSNISLPGDGEDVFPRPGTAVHVIFKSSVISKDVVVLISTELMFDVSSGHVELPLMVCKDVVRQMGTISVVKVASLEVYEHTAQGVARAGVGEVPEHIRGMTNRPIVLAYKFLSPHHSVNLSVLHHQEMRTLESVADSALYELLVTENQKMHILTLLVQNSQRQYMSVRDIPQNATLWSLRVNSLSTTPVRGKDGVLMVPLLVGTGGDSNQAGLATKTSVELAWVSEQPDLGDNGTIVLSAPRIDMPISALSVEVQFPEIYDINFTGTLQRVKTFSHKLPHAVNHQTEKYLVEKNYSFDKHTTQGEVKASVTAKVPRQGRRYRFEKILVVGNGALLSANYTVNQSECKASRRTHFFGWW
eukprot:TRINITY_DN56190_c0_g1_i1.p1 TRINITY_DN56190_c0_g1~~TRINITY_DN56190_c0_g1_i1.p1  ORF type:complete len:733 (-),score=81.54 TRINITY_DN56190_c0_g1_i1:47-2245(-)